MKKITITFNKDVEVDFGHLCRAMTVKFGVTLFTDEGTKSVFAKNISEEKVGEIEKWFRRSKHIDSIATLKVEDCITKSR